MASRIVLLASAFSEVGMVSELILHSEMPWMDKVRIFIDTVAFSGLPSDNLLFATLEVSGLTLDFSKIVYLF